jgi:hypothetical protein
MNEEEIRSKLLLPFLVDLGFEASDIKLEQSFSIRLGRSVHRISGRSDILCKLNGKNLFIIEVKRDSNKLSQNDIDQGISYATALIDGIAPFTIITNGITTKIFDSVTRKELSGTKISGQSNFWQNGCTLSTEEELRIRFVALKNFISFSSDNLKVFCESQVWDRMGPIKGNLNSMNSKFVEELHLRRNGLHTVFDDFITSEFSVFGLVGEAGVGKTSSMCYLALNSLKDKFVLFYNAAIFNKSPLHYISNDLNLFFSGKSESDHILKKLDELGRLVNKSVIIFIDGIDESADPNFSYELSEMAHAVGKLEFIKIIVSCKSNIWDRYMKVRDTYTHLHEQLSKFHIPIPQLNNNPGFILCVFNDEELNELIPSYKKAFGFKGEISKSLHEELKNGFFLRIFSEVYFNKEIPEKVNYKELLKRYIHKSLEKTEIGVEIGLRILSKIGKLLLNNEYDEWAFYKNEGLEVESLLEGLGLSMYESLPEDLFDRNLLQRSNNEDSYNIAFYYSKIRDYIICYHTYSLEKLNKDDFHNVLEEFFKNYIGQSAIDFYMTNASTSHRVALSNFKMNKALSYVAGYENYLNRNFNNFKSKFDPKTENDIGIILPIDLINRDGYALFPLKSDSENRLQYFNLHNPFSGGYNDDPLIQKGVQIVYGTHLSLMGPNQDKVIKKNVFEQVKKLIEKGKFVAYNSDILLCEKVLLIVYFYHKRLGYDFKIEDLMLPRFDKLYPIDLKDLINRIYWFRAVEYYKRKFVPSNQLAHLVEEMLKDPKGIPEYNVIGDTPPFKELFKIVSILLERGHTHIHKHYLPSADRAVSETKAIFERDRQQFYNQVRSLQFSEHQAKLYIEEFFKCLEICYKEFIEYCFPNFTEEFLFLKDIPHEYFFYSSNSSANEWRMMGYRKSPTGQLKFNFRKISKNYQDPFEKDGLRFLRGFSLEMILYNRDSITTVDRIKTGKVDDYSVLRNWVYQMLKSDIEDLYDNMGV